MSYYQKNTALNNAFENQHYIQAEAILQDKVWEKKKRNILIYYLNKGTVLHMLGQYKESNRYFQLADYYIEDYQKNYGLAGLSYISNPSVVPYKGEHFEQILLHYYGALNYLMLNDLDEALVECKRMLLCNQNISDYYNTDDKLHRDAFTHLLMGLVYDAQHDYNNAFIAYRNAYEIYKNDYVKLLGTTAPEQLKKDLLRTAYINGFYADVKMYEQKFNIKRDSLNTGNKSLVCFWNNGLNPVKQQNSITFLITSLGNGYVVFTNLELGLSFPFYVGNNKQQIDDLLNLKFIRVSFPKFVSRQPHYNQAWLSIDSVNYPMELTEPVDAIAHRTLSDRMNKELGEMLLRMAIKKITELKASQNNAGLGAVVNIANTLSEQADTRGWYFLPYSINYTRVYLNNADTTVSVWVSSGNSNSCVDTMSIQNKKRNTIFHAFTTH